MSKRFKKVVAVVCTIAMVLGTMSVNADTSLLGSSTWNSWFEAGGGVTSTDASQEVIDGSLGGDWWGIQTWLPDVTMVKGYTYTTSFTVTTSAPKQFRVDKRVGDGIIFDGEVSVSEWTENADGTYSCTYTGSTTEIAATEKFDLRIAFGYFTGANGVCGDGTEYDGWAAYNAIKVTVSDFSLTREATGETETDPEITTPEGGYTALSSVDTAVGPWILYSAQNSWVVGEMQYKGGTTDSDLSCKIINSSGTPGCWGIQVKYPVSGLTAGTTYKYTVNYSASNAGTMFLKLEGVDEGTTTPAVAGDNTLSATFTAGASLTMVFELSGFAKDTVIDFDGISIVEATGEEPTEEPTEAPTAGEGETTTAALGDDPYAGLTWESVNNTDKYFVAWITPGITFTQKNYDGAGGGRVFLEFGYAPTYKDITVNGVAIATDDLHNVKGAWLGFLDTDLTDNAYNVVKGTNAVGQEFSFVIKAGTPVVGGEEPTEVPTEVPTEEPTEVPTEEPTEAPTEATAPEMVGNPIIQLNDFGAGDVIYVAGLDVIKGANTYNLYVAGELWGEVTNGQNIPVDQFEAGTYLFQVTGVNEVGESAKSEGYTITIPGAVTTYSVTVDGTKIAAVEAGETVTLPTDATYGYYIDGAMYKAGATVTVNSDMAFTSVNTLSVTVKNGAGIMLDGNGTSGIRFEASVATDNMDALASDAITEGMLITANDLYEELGGSTLDLNSTYTVKNIPNSGWYNDSVGLYCGSIVNIVESNYIRKFVAKAYVTINYVDGTTSTEYSNMSDVRSIQDVAKAIQNAGYPGLSAYQSIIDQFAAAN